METALSHWASQLRIPLFFGATFLGFFLSVLYVTGMILPGAVGASIWILTSALIFLCFRLHEVPMLSLSRTVVVFYASLAAMAGFFTGLI